MSYRFLFDLIILFVSYCLSVYLKGNCFTDTFNRFFYLFLAYSLIYVSISILVKKYTLSYKSNNKVFLNKHLFSWASSAVLLLSSIYILQIEFPSRFVILGFLSILLGLNIIWIIILLSYKYAVVVYNKEDVEHLKAMRSALKADQEQIRRIDYCNEENAAIVNLLRKEQGQELLDFLKLHIDKISAETEYLKATSRFNILRIPYVSKNMVNLTPLNDIKKINKYLQTISVKIEDKGLFICCAITNSTRKENFMQQFPWGLNYLLYFFYFIYKRVWPKLPYFKRIYFYFTKGKDRAISHAEVLGRLYSCGFEHVDHKSIGNKTWYVMQKTSAPLLDFNPTYGPLIKLKRIGKNGKIINVFKLRTMHPFSEYIQDYIYQKNELDSGGKFKNDFRISSAGKVFRKFWIDELPMVINIIKGEMKLVGVRPLSEQYFSLYPEDFQKYRINFKPGLLPPYYVDLPKNIDEIVASEKKYLGQYEQKPFRTDLKYFFLILKNILFKRVRSK